MWLVSTAKPRNAFENISRPNSAFPVGPAVKTLQLEPHILFFWFLRCPRR